MAALLPSPSTGAIMMTSGFMAMIESMFAASFWISSWESRMVMSMFISLPYCLYPLTIAEP